MSTHPGACDVKNELLAHILSSTPPAYALLYRPESSEDDCVEIFTGHIDYLNALADLADGSGTHASNAPGPEVLALIPYRQISERGFECVDDKEQLIALRIQATSRLTKAQALEQIPDTGIVLSGEHFDIDDDTYADTARTIIANEIGMGAGSNFVLKRSFLASINSFSHHKALTLFRRILQQEIGAYWIFIVSTGDRFFIGASPERHVSLKQNIVTMNPISGTYRYPDSGPGVEGVLAFLSDPKPPQSRNPNGDWILWTTGESGLLQHVRGYQTARNIDTGQT